MVKLYFTALLILFFGFRILAGTSEKMDTLSRSQLQRIKYEVGIISDFPAALLPANTKQAWLAVGFKENGDYEAMLLFNMDDSLFLKKAPKLIPVIPDSIEGSTEEQAKKNDSIESDMENEYTCHFPYAKYENGQVIAECNFMRGIFYKHVYAIVENTLVFVNSSMYDLNDWVYASADTAIKTNDPVRYCQAYMGAQYYSDYNFRIKESLEMAYSLALNYYKMQDYKKAGTLMFSMETECETSKNQVVELLIPEVFKKIWSDVTLMYLKANMNIECVNLSQWMIQKHPNLTPVYLQYADALFNLKRKKESHQMYLKYQTLMVKKGHVKSIPSRVIERLR
jgi:hypothetical protein